MRNGTNVVDDVLAKYKAAWAERGFIGENGLFRRFYTTRQKRLVESEEIGHSAWWVSPVLGMASTATLTGDN